MAKLKWICSNVPNGMKVTQIYGILFTKEKKILLKLEDGKYSLIGGKPENYENSYEQTLVREVLEEVNTTIYKPIYLGYQEVDEENNKPIYAQVRMTALINNIGEEKPDPDNGKIYQRIIVDAEEAIRLLGWGMMGKLQIEAALEMYNCLEVRYENN